MEDIQINEQALLEWQEKYKKNKPKALTWIDNLYNKVNLSISRYFRKVSWNFKEWRDIMRMENEEVKSLYESRRLLYKSTSLYFPTGLSAYFCADGYVRYRTPWEIYSKIVKNPTITGFVEFTRKWKPGTTKEGFPPGKLTDFEAMFLNAD
jgi:hypothetical protein